VEAAAALAPQFPRARFLIVGDADMKWNRSYRADLEALAEASGIGGRVEFAGFRRDVQVLLAAMDVFVLPSSSPEPLGLVVLEAMAAGTPVVATAHGGPVELLHQGESGLLVPPADGGAIAAAVARILSEPDLQARLVREGRARAQEFSIERHVEALVEVYGRALGGRVPDEQIIR